MYEDLFDIDLFCQNLTGIYSFRFLSVLLLQDLAAANHRCDMVKLALESSSWVR